MDSLPIPSMARSASADDDMAEFTLSAPTRGIPADGGLRRTLSQTDPAEIGVADESSFRLGGTQSVRSLAVETALSGPGSLSGPQLGMGGASMALSGAVFGHTAAAAAATQAGSLTVPLLPCYRTVQKRSSYRSSAPLRQIVLDLEAGFTAQGVYWQAVGGSSSVRYECNALARHSKLEFEISCFALATGEHVVDIVPLSGCRAAFRDFYAGFAAGLIYASAHGARASASPRKRQRQFAALPLPAATLAEMEIVPAGVDKSAAAPPTEALAEMMQRPGLTGAGAARAVAALAANPEAGELFFHDQENNGAAPTPLAQAVARAAAGEGGDEAAALLACATIANMAAAAVASTPSAAMAATRDFFVAQLPALREQLKDSECAHTRRECLRAIAVMAEGDAALRASVMRAGLVDLLELEAEVGQEDGRCEDHLARGHAHCALVACRS